jgi:hypothetical protein
MLACELERLFVVRADLLHRNSLLEAVVAGHEQVVDPLLRLRAINGGIR